MTMTPPVRIAIMGAGLIGQRHIAHILAEPAAALHAVIDPSPAGEAAAAAAGVPWFADFDAMMAAGRPDAVLAATPNALHVTHGLQAIAARLPVLVEKPIADSLDGARQLVAASEAAGVPLLIGHHRRHNTMIQRAKAVIESGRLGRLVAAHSFFWLMKPDDYFEMEWRRNKGAGPLLLNMIHDLDLMRYLCGEVAAVQAFQSRAVRGHAVDETTVVSMQFANGALGTFNVSDTVVAPWSWEQTSGENPGYPHTDQNCYFIAGTHGALSVPRLEVWSNRETRSWWEPLATERITAVDADPLRRQIAHFCAVARGEAQPLVSGREGLMTLQVIDAVQRAAESGQCIRLD